MEHHPNPLPLTSHELLYGDSRKMSIAAGSAGWPEPDSGPARENVEGVGGNGERRGHEPGEGSVVVAVFVGVEGFEPPTSSL